MQRPLLRCATQLCEKCLIWSRNHLRLQMIASGDLGNRNSIRPDVAALLESIEAGNLEEEGHSEPPDSMIYSNRVEHDAM